MTGEGWELLTSDGDKPLLVEARTPDAAIEALGTSLTNVDGKAVAIPDSSWHEFLPRRGWARTR